MLAPWTALALAVLSAASSAQTTWYVDVNAAPPGLGTQLAPYSSIQYAISRPTTGSGDTVLVLPGTYNENVNLLGKGIALRSLAGAALTRIDAQQQGAAVVIASGEVGASLQGLTLVNGSGASALGTTVGGGLFCSGTSPLILDCVISNCTATLGGGVGILGGSPLIQQSVIRDNIAVADFNAFIEGEGGGVFMQNAASAHIQDSSVLFNQCDGSGAGILAENSTLTLGVVSILDNSNFGFVFGFGGEGGGGLATFGGGSTIATNCTISRNRVEGAMLPTGGGVFAISPVTLQTCAIEDNDAGNSNISGQGGGVAGNVSLIECALRRNYADLAGGGAYGAFIDRSYVEQNCSFEGGGAYGCFIQDSFIRGNYGCSTASEDFGAGAHSSTLVRCVIEGNVVAGHGAGAVDSTLTDCDVLNNQANAAGPGFNSTGGGLRGGAATNCRIGGNSCSGDFSSTGQASAGGGAHSTNLVRCEVFANQAIGGTDPGFGGAAANCTLTLCSVFGNQASEGGGVFGGSADRCTLVGNQALSSTGGGAASAALASCIVRDNAPAQVLTSTVRYSNVQGGVAGIGNINSDPLFWNPATRDYHLRPGSPCINTGDPAAPLDSDGSRADMGAFPFDANYCTSPVSYCTAKTNSLGCLPAIGWTGSPTLSGADDFTLQASNVIGGRFGLVFWGYQPNATPYQGGLLCVYPPTIRTPAQLSPGSPGACDGSYSHAFTQAYMAQNALVAGQQIYFQWWMRDPGAFANTGLSNALAVTICP